MPRRVLASLAALAVAAAGCGQKPTSPPPPTQPAVTHRVIEIDIDDHGLKGLWNADAPNLKGLIARGTFAYTRVIVPTHSNQSNMSLLTGQYPDGDNVPGNAWLDRSASFTYPIDLGPLSLGNYGFWPENPLRIRGQSIYRYAETLGDHPAYFGQLPPFEAGADNVHFTIVGRTLAGIPLDAATARSLLEGVLKYPKDVVDGYHLDGPGAKGETISHFVMSDAAKFIDDAKVKDIPKYMFVWDFIALDGDPTSTYGADGPQLQKVIEDYDNGIGLILAALKKKKILDHTDIIFTLDHGKVDSHKQVVLGTHGGSASGAGNGQLGALVDGPMGKALGITSKDYGIVNEDGDAQIYAKVKDAGTAAGLEAQLRITHDLVDIVQSGQIQGLDTTRTMTWDGYKGTRRFDDYHDDGPYQADIIVFPKPDWTLNQVDKNNTDPGPFKEHTKYPYGRHGGFSTDELYVPLIMAGPSFKKGVILPEPVDHPDVASTAAYILGGKTLETAEGEPIWAALKGDPGRTLPQPSDMSGTRPTVLARAGYAGTQSLANAPAQAAVIVDVGGLYYDEIFRDQAVPASASRAFRELAAKGASFESFYDRYRDWPVNEYDMLVGGYPIQIPYIPYATDDPAQDGVPGFGLREMPVPAGYVSDPVAMADWRADTDFGVPSIFDAAKAMGLSTALIGRIDYQDRHIDTGSIDEVKRTTGAGAAAEVKAFLAAHPKSLMVVSIGGHRTANRDSAAAANELAKLGEEVTAIAGAAPGALVVVTSRGATPLAGPPATNAGTDFYGPQSSRHVPLILVGPNVRKGVVIGEPGQMADIPATVLVGLGHATETDFVEGTWAKGTPVDGVPAPDPAGATGGHALMAAYQVSP